jgi:microcystin-dependent protein
MNSINFFTGDKFPLYREALAKLQEQIQFVAQLAGIGSNQNYIVSGVEGNGQGAVSPGLIVINGELLPFEGGIVPSNISTAIKIEEVKTDVDAFGITYPEVYTTRVAKFSQSGQYDFYALSKNKIKTILELQTLIEGGGDEPGVVKMWAGLIERIPQNYHLADGSLMSVADYPKLHQNIGYVFGGNGNSTFALPNLSGRFIAGYNLLDTDYNLIGKAAGEKKVTLTENQIPAHTHENRFKYAGVDDTDSPNHQALVADNSSGTNYSVESLPKGEGMAHENRPPFFVLAYIIKVK